MSDQEPINVEVAYALPQRQKIYQLLVKPGTTALRAAEQPSVRQDFAGVNLASASMGIFGQGIKEPEKYVLKPGDRVEIYRPLIIDPKQARRKRAAKMKKT